MKIRKLIGFLVEIIVEGIAGICYYLSFVLFPLIILGTLYKYFVSEQPFVQSFNEMNLWR